MAFVLSSVSSHLGHLPVEAESGCEHGFWSTTACVALAKLLMSLCLGAPQGEEG